MGTAILHYGGAPRERPNTSRRSCTSDSPCLVLNCPFTYFPEENTNCKTFDELKAASTEGRAPPATKGTFKEFFLNFGDAGGADSVNAQQFHTPDVNLLTQSSEWSSPCDKPECGPGKFCVCTTALEISKGDTVQLVLLNMGVGKESAHPIHLHGHSFRVVKMGYGRYNGSSGHVIGDNLDIDCRGNEDRELSFCDDATWANQTWLDGNVPEMNLKNPPRKDTIIVPSGGYVVIRFVADSAGLWNMHCHIEVHNLEGMSLLLNVSFADVPAAPYGFPVCSPFPRSAPVNDNGHSHPVQENKGR